MRRRVRRARGPGAAGEQIHMPGSFQHPCLAADGRSSPGLARGVHDEVRLLVDQSRCRWQSGQRRNHIMFGGHARTGRVETATYGHAPEVAAVDALTASYLSARDQRSPIESAGVFEMGPFGLSQMTSAPAALLTEERMTGEGWLVRWLDLAVATLSSAVSGCPCRR